MRWRDKLNGPARRGRDVVSGRGQFLAGALRAYRWRRGGDDPYAGWYAEAQRERADEHRWRSCVGLDVAAPRRVTAPSDFTARVLARIETEAEQPLAAVEQRALSALAAARVLIGTVGVAALFALVSGCLVALIAPAQTMALLSALLRVAVVLLVLLRASLGLTGQALVSPVVLVLLAALPLLWITSTGQLARLAGRLARDR